MTSTPPHKQLSIPLSNTQSSKSTQKLLQDVRQLIESARSHVAHAVNVGLVMLNWHIGKRIHRDILNQKRAEYGERIVTTLAQKLTTEYGYGYTADTLFRMVKFNAMYSNREIVATLSQQLGWSHFVQLIAIADPLKRDFYAEMCRIERWSVRTLRKKIGGMLFERTGLSRKPEDIAKVELAKLHTEDQLSPDMVFRDPYFLDFLNLQQGYSEKDLESAILRDLEQFLVELGTDFTFVARQKRMHLGTKDYYLDLLFFHRRLRSLVAIELKLTPFEPAAMGQMEFYLRWLEKHEKRPEENAPLGLILCASKDHADVELVCLNPRGIRISEYLTQLPPRQLLKKRLHDSIRLAQEHLES